MSSFVSLAAVKEALGITQSNDDGVLNSAIVRASALVDAYLHAIRPGYVGIAVGSNFYSSVGSNTRTYSGTGDDILFIDDAMSVSAVTVDGTAIAATAYTAAPYNSVPKRWLEYILPVSSTQGLTPAIWSRGTANIGVTGYFGFNFVPDDVANTALELAVLIWRRYIEHQPAPTGLADPEVLAICSALDYGWRVPTLRGAGAG
jgi:hypothetical protein